MNRSLVALRSVTPDDATHLAELWTDVIRRVGPEDQAADMEAVIATVLASTDQRIVVAEYDGKFAGAVHLESTTISAVNREPVVRALSPHVLAPYRRHGIGTALMESAVTWAEELGVTHVATAAVAGSRDANRFMARIALGPYAVLRVATTHAVRSRLSAAMRPAGAGNGHGRQLTQVLAARRSLRRSRAGVEG
jgi:GNAT superfamily N-acetyltransferase